ncbi:MAG: peptidoglycan editing factor PgeF [Armatimonadetes bacterium]|nr:peptidoglycan editing factor PgeF [Armatimonadota bacterium]
MSSDAAVAPPAAAVAVTPAVPLLLAPTVEGTGVVHGFTTRLGGVSGPPYATLNLGRGVGDAPALVAENRRRALAALGAESAAHVEASQVHGGEVAVVGRADRGRKVEGADGLVSAEPDVILAIHAADCVPILLWDPRRGAVGAVHAGWRGTAAGVAAAAVATMRQAFGTEPADLRVGIGPAIGPCHYEVDTPVAEAFAAWPCASSVLRPGRPGYWHLDLVEANRRMLEEAGVPDAQIWSSGSCTACHRHLFFSYRREGLTGRMGALIGVRRAPRISLPPSE